MSTLLKALKLLRSPARFSSSLRLPIPQLRLRRFSTTTTTYARSPKQKPRSPKQKPQSPKQKPQSPKEKPRLRRARCYGEIPLDIAGTQFHRYTSNASPGEALVVHRDPRNLYVYGYNTFRVDKANGATVGYVPFILAQKLAPLVDEGLITLKMRAEGQVAANMEVFGVGEMDARVRELPLTKKKRAQEPTVRKLLNAEKKMQELIHIHTDSVKYWAEALLIDLFLDFHRSIDTRTRALETAAKKSAKKSAKAAVRALETETKKSAKAARAPKTATKKSAKAARAPKTATKKSAKAAARALKTERKKSAKAAARALKTERKKSAKAAARALETERKKSAEAAARALETEMKKCAEATARAVITEMKKSAEAAARASQMVIRNRK